MKNLYLFYGSEELMIKNKIDKLVNSIKTDQYNINIYDMNETNINSVLEDAMMVPFLVDKKVVIMNSPNFLKKESLTQKKDCELFENYLKSEIDYSVIIIDASGLDIDQNNEVVKLLFKKAEVSETKELSDVEMKGWLIRKINLASKEISSSSVDLFFERTGYNLISATNEIDKLLNYVKDKNVITDDDVRNVVVKDLENDVFVLVNATIDGNKEKIIKSYQDLVKVGNDPVRLIGLVSNSIKTTYNVLVMLKNGYKQVDIASSLGLSPGRAYYVIKSARSFKIETLEETIMKLHNLDYQIKSGRIDKFIGFEMFLFGYSK